jgi:hypothetical protein
LKNEREEAFELSRIIDKTYYIILSKIAIYLITTIITCRERKILTTEIEASPLINVDETLTEELYKNILQQSKNPEDNELVKQYRKISNEIMEKRKKIEKDTERDSSKNNLTLEENSTSEIISQKVLDSINLNVSERRSDVSREFNEFSSKILFKFF